VPAGRAPRVSPKILSNSSIRSARQRMGAGAFAFDTARRCRRVAGEFEIAIRPAGVGFARVLARCSPKRLISESHDSHRLYQASRRPPAADTSVAMPRGAPPLSLACQCITIRVAAAADGMPRLMAPPSTVILLWFESSVRAVGPRIFPANFSSFQPQTASTCVQTPRSIPRSRYRRASQAVAFQKLCRRKHGRGP